MTAVVTNTYSYKCPNCGGALEFQPQTQQYQCDYCKTELSQAELTAVEPDPVRLSEEEAVYYQCSSCGAEIVTDATTAATFCFYCHNPVVLAGRVAGVDQPDQVIPFTIDRAKAVEIFEQWLKRKRYLPKEFVSVEQIETMTGVYFPYWLYHCRIDGKIDARCENRRVWTNGSTEYTEVKSFQVSRAGAMQIEHVPRNALQKADKELVDAVLPYQMESLKVFSMSYLAGFFAEKRDLEKELLQQEVEKEVKDYAADHLRNSIHGYQNVTVGQRDVKIEHAGWHYIMLPVWTLTYRNKKDDQIYYFACNGQTGKVCGMLPVDYKKLIILFLAVFLPVLCVLLLVGYWI